MKVCECGVKNPDRATHCMSCGEELPLPIAKLVSAMTIKQHRQEAEDFRTGSRFYIEYERKRFGLAPREPDETFKAYAERIEREKSPAVVLATGAFRENLQRARDQKHLR